MNDDQRCGAETNEGEPCRAPVALCSNCGRCRMHCAYDEGCDYDEEEVSASRSRGAQTTNAKNRGDGLAPHELPPLTSHEAAEKWCAVVGQAAATGRLSSSAANAVLRSVQTWMDARDEGRVSEKIEALEDALAEWRKTGSPEAVLEVVEGEQP